MARTTVVAVAASRTTGSDVSDEPSGSLVPAAVRRSADGLAPGSFAIVMATGIVALDAHDLHAATLARALTLVCIAAYLLLLALFVVRLVHHHPAVRTDMTDPSRAFALLTLVAGTDVVAALPALRDWRDVLFVGGAVALVAWIVLLPAALLAAHRLPTLWHHARGDWLLAVVATQSLAIVIALLAVPDHDVWSVVAVAAWTVGAVGYLALIVPVTRRLVHVVRRGELYHFSADFWITMGAAAISALAGARIVVALDVTGAHRTLVDAMQVGGIAMWCIATAWVPVLVVLEAMKLRRVGGLPYAADRWSSVFPLGMFAAASSALGTVLNVPALHRAGYPAACIALAAWALTALGLLHSASRRDNASRPSSGGTAS